MENVTKSLWTVLSFTVPLIGITLYFVSDKKREAKVYGIIGFIGIFVYMAVGMGFI